MTYDIPIDNESIPVKCPNCLESEHYYPTASMVFCETIFHGNEYGHCLHCNYLKEMNSPSLSNGDRDEG